MPDDVLFDMLGFIAREPQAQCQAVMESVERRLEKLRSAQSLVRSQFPWFACRGGSRTASVQGWARPSIGMTRPISGALAKTCQGRSE